MSPQYRSLTRPLPTDARARWRVEVDGVELPHVRHVVIEHPSFGTLSYGLTAAGHDGWSFHEQGGGGSVILPFASLEGELFVGVIEQLRPHQGGLVLHAPRGFLDPGEAHADAARRELLEETGLAVSTDALFELPGAPANPNSAFFETAGEGEGVRFYGLELPDRLLVGSGGRRGLHPDAVSDARAARRSRLAEQIGAVCFVPWHEASRLSDMFTVAAVARLLVARRVTLR